MTKNKLHNDIAEVFYRVYKEQTNNEYSELKDTDVLLKTGLDSLGFAIFITELEEVLGYDPFSIAEDPYYPETFGELVKFYEEHQPQ